jgi:hypothetical protein
MFKETQASLFHPHATVDNCSDVNQAASEHRDSPCSLEDLPNFSPVRSTSRIYTEFRFMLGSVLGLNGLFHKKTTSPQQKLARSSPQFNSLAAPSTGLKVNRKRQLSQSGILNDAAHQTNNHVSEIKSQFLSTDNDSQSSDHDSSSVDMENEDSVIAAQFELLYELLAEA